MAGETLITVVGNLTADPELRFTQSGLAVANFTIASTPRTFNRQTNEWEDGETLFLRSSIWRDAAEHVAESLEKGSRVIAQGFLKQRAFQDREGNQRTAIELDVQEVGPSLKYATAKPVKAPQQGGQAWGGQQPGYAPQGAQQGGYQQGPPPGQQAPQGTPQQGQGWAPQGQPPAGAWGAQQGPPPGQQAAPQGQQWAGQQAPPSENWGGAARGPNDPPF